MNVVEVRGVEREENVNHEARINKTVRDEDAALRRVPVRLERRPLAHERNFKGRDDHDHHDQNQNQQVPRVSVEGIEDAKVAALRRKRHLRGEPERRQNVETMFRTMPAPRCAHRNLKSIR